ncbi:hypothetical protein AVEN_256033-1 [Araneus ventricosus]|uniref:Uncharacterized protein n=1 Tax=Araneus ventricosus TaxID=182803 RepID=A0A4Y2JJK0_ARAVE|nr:hypothetical protein AVEN_256033-1 [Araneus ventricosus]
MTKEIIITAFVLLSWIWSLFKIFCNLSFWYLFHLFPYVVFIMILKSLADSKQKKNRDVALQTEPECIQMKDVSTVTTDMFAGGDVTKPAPENHGRILLLVKN